MISEVKKTLESARAAMICAEKHIGTAMLCEGTEQDNILAAYDKMETAILLLRDALLYYLPIHTNNITTNHMNAGFPSFTVSARRTSYGFKFDAPCVLKRRNKRARHFYRAAFSAAMRRLISATPSLEIEHITRAIIVFEQACKAGQAAGVDADNIEVSAIVNVLCEYFIVDDNPFNCQMIFTAHMAEQSGLSIHVIDVNRWSEAQKILQKLLNKVD